MTALIVDDSKLIRDKVGSLLGKLKYGEIYFASNGKEAIEKYKEKSPDFVTMDITMPDMDGITALKKILKIDVNAKVIMLTSHGLEDMMLKAMGEGALGYITKPAKIEDIKDAIYKAFN